MATYVFKGDQGVQKLRKSRKLVGLRLKEDLDEHTDKSYIAEELIDFLGGFRVVTLDADEHDLDSKLDEVRSDDDVALGTHVFFAEGSNKPLIPTGEINITFEIGTNEEEQSIVLDEFALQLVERRSPTFVIAHVSDESPNPVKAAASMQASCLVRLAEPDFDTLLDRYDVHPPDPLLSHQWSLKNAGRLPDSNVALRFGADAKVVEAWSKLGNLGDSSIRLALIDDGFDTSHPDLKNKIKVPFDFRYNSSQIKQGNPNYTHGTPCATIALGASNGVGMVGVAPTAQFIPLEGTSFSDRITEAQFNHCIRNQVDIISCSWGTTDPGNRLNYRKREAIAKAAREGRNGKGCVILFAAGNEGLNTLNYYATHPDVIAVGSSTSNDLHASYSNQGPELTVVAPSSGEWPVMAGRAWWDRGNTGQQGQFRFWVDGVSRGQNYKHFGGTSSSTPLVAGICALILSANPNLTAREV
ncbi:MAG: S8 family serine peptidase, partial [Saprospiraceae bacterium]|nr:S8 family serine peptidase [Saprospiraceae bacterium]